MENSKRVIFNKKGNWKGIGKEIKWSQVFGHLYSAQTLGKCNQDLSPVKSEMQDWNPTIPNHLTQYKSYPVPKDLRSILTNLSPSAFPYTRDHKRLRIYQDKCNNTCCVAVLSNV